MDNPGYVSITRLTGLAAELRVVANNLANASTTGFRGEKVVFAEVLENAQVDGGALSMAAPRAHVTDTRPGGLTQTGGTFDLAVEGEGYFQIETPNGPRLTRAGAFMRNAEGAVVTADGNALLGPGGAPVQLPPEAVDIQIAPDGAVSAGGAPVAEIGLFDAPVDALVREAGAMFRVAGGMVPAEGARMLQGFIEQSNVEPVEELTRMIEVQRAYELGMSFMNMEDERMRTAVQTLGRAS